jgi:hypothetical protein
MKYLTEKKDHPLNNPGGDPPNRKKLRSASFCDDAPDAMPIKEAICLSLTLSVSNNKIIFSLLCLP